MIDTFLENQFQGLDDDMSDYVGNGENREWAAKELGFRK